jgi:16S rRNA (cytidine1402-2'-O)-methyltransferase
MTMRTATGTLYLVPVTLGGADAGMLLPPATLEVVRRLRHFVVENPKSARHFLRAAGYPRPLRDAQMKTLDEHTPAHELPALLEALRSGHDCGLMSEAGCPAVADPGAVLVRLAHEAGIRVAPLVGPSAILLALMGSGMNGQRFAFHSYLPVDRDERARRLRELEEDASRSGASHAFIETPYRNSALLQAVLESCRPDTALCIAADLTLPTESVTTRSIAEWKKTPPVLDRRPTVFVISRG